MKTNEPELQELVESIKTRNNEIIVSVEYNRFLEEIQLKNY